MIYKTKNVVTDIWSTQTERCFSMFSFDSGDRNITCSMKTTPIFVCSDVIVSCLSFHFDFFSRTYLVCLFLLLNVPAVKCIFCDISHAVVVSKVTWEEIE